jgi:glutathione S-transferase
MLPVVEIDGVIITDSAAIAATIEDKFPDNNPLVQHLHIQLPKPRN